MTYIVQAGDNLWSIAARFGVSVQALASVNRIANPQSLYVGQTLYIPEGTTPAYPGQTTAAPQPAASAAVEERMARLEREFDQIVTILDDHRRQIAELGRRIRKVEQQP
jgi:spore germination protein YaaH